jgi:signal transduction histidine kinase
MASPGSVGRKWNDIISETELSFEAITSGRGVSTEKEIEILAAGQRKSILVAVSRLSDWEGQGAGMVAAVYDMTHLRELETQTARKERLSEMGNLAAGVAHEIRNPLNTISIAAQRLATEFTPADKPQEYLSFTSQIRSETKRLDGIISRFLALAREKSKKRSSVRLDTLINQVAEFLRPEAHKLAIDLYVQVTSGLEVEADTDGLKQVFSNLFNNAKEALNGQPGRISITARSEEDGIEIRFADSGPGIPKKERGKVFTPYYTTKEAGTGLGLPAVHKLITEQGGDIRVETSKWGGACFVITIPRK